MILNKHNLKCYNFCSNFIGCAMVNNPMVEVGMTSLPVIDMKLFKI